MLNYPFIHLSNIYPALCTQRRISCQGVRKIRQGPGLFYNVIYILYILNALVAASGGYSSLCCTGFSLRWLLSLWSMDSRVRGLKEVPLPGSRAQVQQVWSTSLGAPLHVGSSQTRDQIHVSCSGRQTVYL